MSSARLYRNPAFVLFLSARTISFAGTGITVIVLPVLVYRITSSPAAVASLNAIETVPYLAFGLLAGALADRLNRKRMMVVCEGAAALLLAAVPVAAALHLLTLAQLFVVAFGIGTAFVWFDAANFGSLPNLVDRAQLPAASSLSASSNSVPLLAGPVLGGALLTVMAAPSVLGVDAASYAVSALLLASIRRPLRPPQREQEQRQRVRSDAGELGGLISLAAIPMLVKRQAIGRLMAAFLAANVAALALVAIAPSYGWALPLFCCYQLVFVVVTMTGITVRRMLTPDHLQARVNTAGRLIAYGGQPIGAALGGLLAELLPIRLTFVLLAIAVAVGAGLAGWSCLGSRPLSAVSISAPISAP